MTTNDKEDKEQEIEDWRNEHGQPDAEFLRNLANQGNLDSLDKLRSIAEDMDINFGPDSSAQELVDLILSESAKNEDDGFEPLG